MLPNSLHSLKRASIVTGCSPVRVLMLAYRCACQQPPCITLPGSQQPLRHCLIVAARLSAEPEACPERSWMQLSQGPDACILPQAARLSADPEACPERAASSASELPARDPREAPLVMAPGGGGAAASPACSARLGRALTDDPVGNGSCSPATWSTCGSLRPCRVQDQA